MRVMSFNDGWKWRHVGQTDVADPRTSIRKSAQYGKEFQEVELPHDAMIGEPRTPDAPSAGTSGWFEGADYEYVKDFSLDGADEGKTLVLEFEGVYRDAEVWVNDTKMTTLPYGYTGFFVDVTDVVSTSEVNEVRVIAHNSDQPNSRWYSGAGIYRPVNLWVGGKHHIYPDQVHIATESIDPPIVAITARSTPGGRLTAIVEAETESGTRTFTTSADVTSDRTTLRLTLPGAKLWSPETPVIHQCSLRLVSANDEDRADDEAFVSFGIRTVALSDKGFLLNGRRVILQGACIHHDNGLLGACAYPDAEERKVRLMQENGYNAIRSAHNPCSKAMLDACDRLGMLVLDEYADQWYIHKTKYDYANRLEDYWRADLEAMVNKDFNHPSVIMYSLGNEVAETAQKRGVALTRNMTRYLHSLDQTRPVTCGINIFFNFLSFMGLGVYSDKKAEREGDTRRPKNDGVFEKLTAVGSEFYNNLAGIAGADFMKAGATLPPCDVLTRDAFAELDVAGYNYGIRRYQRDLKKYPHRFILGTETFCGDAYRFREEAKRSPRLIGDFVWAGIDHLGEVGVGAWEYRDYAPKDTGFGWLTSAQGRLDLTGKPLGEALYTRVALELDPGPYIAVRPVNHTGERHTPSAWRMSNARPTWSWNGCEGKKAEIEVYARAASVALTLNGKTIGRKVIPKNDCKVTFTCDWQPGTLSAIALDERGRTIGKCSLTSASDTVELRAEPEEEIAYSGGLCYVRLRYTDEKGEGKPLEDGHLKVAVEGAELVGLGNASPFNLGSFLSDSTATYFGEAMAVLRVPSPAGEKITVSVSDNLRSAEVSLPVSSQKKAER
ncbi:glycoside hydrolase family 2 TIM barrel-domain containing protein [Actinomycetaceae bacterium MB13-C1-2]|nr:glycoside hydrolase family 2 TIM barrel-domain containing protein [Actinomycetaceae bacterium MB13-C1-2]